MKIVLDNELVTKSIFFLRWSIRMDKDCDYSADLSIYWNQSCLLYLLRIFSIVRLGLFSTHAIFGRAYFRVMLIFELCLFLKVTRKWRDFKKVMHLMKSVNFGMNP